jgi:hypothetical protein
VDVEALFLASWWSLSNVVEVGEYGFAGHPLDPTARSTLKTSVPFFEVGPVISAVAISG